MAYQYVTVNGQRVERNVAEAFQRLRAAFQKQWGLDLLVSSGTRTRAEQTKLRNAYLAYKAGRGPWAPLAAAPGYSNHEESGPRGPRALDLRDSGRDAGVTTIGTERSNWLAREAKKFGFHNAGHFFNPKEGWHYEYTGAIGNYSTPAQTPTTSVGEIHEMSLEDDMAIIIVQRKDSKLAKGMYNPETGRLREVTRSENTMLRELEKKNSEAVKHVEYVTVTDADYDNLLRGRK